MGKNNARMIDPSLFIQAGIDRKTGLPLKLVTGAPSQLKRGMKHFLRLIDEQDAVNRYEWTIPEGLDLTGQEIERWLYYKGQLCLFKLEGKYYLTCYALDGKIDLYGRYNTVHPVPFASGMEYSGEDDPQKKVDDQNYKNQMSLLSQLKLRVIYTNTAKDVKPENCCVLLHDYTKQISQNIIARYLINDPLLDVMACTIPYLKTAMIAATGVKGIRVADADQYEQVNIGARDVDNHALTGKIWYPILGNMEFQELTDKSGAKMAEFMETLQSLDNLRRQAYGLDTNGVFQKSSHMLESENEMNASNTALVMEDGLKIRQHFCELAKYVFGLDIQVKVKQDQETELDNGEKDNKEETNNEQTEI